MAREDYPGVKAGTLNRFAKSKGTWIPQGCEILTALGLVKEPNPFRVLPRWYERTPEALEYYQHKKEQARQMSRNTRHPEEDTNEYIDVRQKR